MKFSIPTNWSEDLAEIIISQDRKERISEVYGKLALDEIGGGRTASSLVFVSKNKARRHIKELQDSSMNFNYLLNTLCMDNLEFTRPGQRKLEKTLAWLNSSGINRVTVANPYIFMWIKRNYPKMAISVSVMAGVNSVERAKFWEGLGADKITFPGPAVNRNFSLIRKLRLSLRCKIQLIANGACLNNCPFFISHALMNSHASQAWHTSRGYMFDYYNIMCRLRRLEDKTNFIKADWIRPEDIKFYEGLGIDSIKLIDRRLPTSLLSKIIRAYMEGKYQGNLLDILPLFGGSTFDSDRGLKKKLFYLRLPFTGMNPFKIIGLSKVFSKLKVNIDNQSLEGFLQGIPQGCDINFCRNCNYCRDTADRTVKVDLEYARGTIKEYQETLNNILKNGLSF